MDEFEICQSYRLAKNKNKQVRVLAQLNLVTPERIVEILKRHGIRYTGKVDRRGGKKPRFTPEQIEKMKAMAREGKSSAEIARILGENQQIVYYHIHKKEARQ